MAFYSMGMDWNDGEDRMHNLMLPPGSIRDNPTAMMLTPQASFLLQRAPLLALGTLDQENRPWTTLWGGSPHSSEPLGGNLLGTRTLVDGTHDPVVQALAGNAKRSQTLQPTRGSKMLAGLTIDLMTRKRVKIAGHVVAVAIDELDVQVEGGPQVKQHQIQLVSEIDQSLGNCPKYLNQYEIRPAPVNAELVSQGPSLTEEARALVTGVDMFFLSTSTETDADTNHRGGPPGFVRVISDTEIVYPEYSGNNLYQSLGNMQVNPKIGITFPNYITGDVLYITGTTEVLTKGDAAAVLPGSNLAVKIKITEARFVKKGLPFRGVQKIPSPYNPLVRTLVTEGNIKATVATGTHYPDAQLIKKELLTPSIARFTFSVPGGIEYQPGQWIAMDFKEHLDMGYSHMRDDDPQSLNDDFVRTFTISSIPMSEDGKDPQFQLTVRKNGPVTHFLFRQNERSGLEVKILGVGGEFKIKQEENEMARFIAGGVGITPLLGQLKLLTLSPERFKLYWTMRTADINAVVDILQHHPDLAASTELFLTGSNELSDKADELKSKGVTITHRRIQEDDLDKSESITWHMCAGKPLRKQVLSWLTGRNVVFEDFDY